MEEFQKAIVSWKEATSAGKSEEAQTAAMQALNLVAEESLRNPSPSLLLRQEADNLELKCRWSEAEAVRRKVLALEDTTGNFGLIAKAQIDLCNLLRLVSRLEEATQLACAATDSARRTGIFPVVVMALRCEVRCSLERGDSTRALAAAEEALNLIEPGNLYDSMRAKALTTRARCLLANNDPTAAGVDLAASWELLQAQSGDWMMNMPGPIWAMASWWEVKSQLERRQGNLDDAREAITRAIDYHRRNDGPYALLALAQALEALGEISKAADDLADEERALDEAKSIRVNLQLPRSL